MLYFFCLHRGALTSKPYSFVARPWEFKTIESIDFFDSTLSSIRLDLRGDKILRILPRINENINEEWISDRIRFSVDGFRAQRVDRPFMIVGKNTHILSWSLFMNIVFKLFSDFSNINAVKKLQLLKSWKTVSKVYDVVDNTGRLFFPFRIVNFGVFSDFESSVWLNFFNNIFFFKKLIFEFKAPGPNFRSSFLIPVLFKDFFKIKNLLLIGINPRTESPILNIRLRQSVIKFGNSVSSFGQNFTSNFSLLLNSGILSFASFLMGNHWLCPFFFLKNQSMVLINSNLGNYFYNFNFSKNLRIGIFNCYSSTINLNEAGLAVQKPEYYNKFPLVELSLGANAPIFKKKNDSCVRIVVTSHGGPNLMDFDLILPTSAPFERNSSFVNLEGRVQLSRFALPSPNNVLDFKDSVIILLTQFSSEGHNKVLFDKTIILFLSFSFYLLLFSGDKKSMWSIIYKLLNSFFISKSLFTKEFFSIVLEYVKEETSSFLYNSNVSSEDFFNKQKCLTLTNKNSGSLFETIENFYIQDEISRSSFSMLAANDRLTFNQNYV